jgi:hypothetical protein
MREGCEMKSRHVAFVGIFCAASLIARGAYAGKPPRPEKPDRPNLTIECIVFTDNENDEDLEHVYLQGGEDCAVVGCCPNAGPPARYMMTLHNVCYTSAFGTPECLQEEEPFLGYLFMNGYGRNAPYEGWKVQFWTVYFKARRPVGGDFFFQIRGGTGGTDKKTKVTVVEFLDDEDATLWVYYDENPECDWANDPTCEPCLNEVQPSCDPRIDPECVYPCWIEQPLENVSFRIVRIADLTYTSGEYGVTCPDTPCDYP